MDQPACSAELLAKLRNAHFAVLKCIAEMEQITAEATPDVIRYTAARLRISQASRERRLLWQHACRYLHDRVTADHSNDLRHLGMLDSELGLWSAAHIGRWTVKAIESDWIGYRQASRLMRRRMADCVAAEKRLLFPILARYR